MNPSLNSESHTWDLNEMEEVHLTILKQAVDDIAYGQTEDGRRRLFPHPLGEEESFLEEEFLEDWREFVSDELEERFGADVKLFLDDLAKAQSEEVELEDGEKIQLFHLSLPMDHGPSWFSTLNQARLMMDQKWKFHNENDQFVPFLTPAVLGDLNPQERFAAYLRYDVYCMIQEWLVKNVL